MKGAGGPMATPRRSESLDFSEMNDMDVATMEELLAARGLRVRTTVPPSLAFNACGGMVDTVLTFVWFGVGAQALGDHATAGRDDEGRHDIMEAVQSYPEPL